MRRILTTALASSLLALAIPAAASAHHGSRHHHRRHHHTIVFSPSARRSDTPSGTQTPTMPAEQAATVASFEGGVLKLTLADGSTVSGKVTENTRIECGRGNDQFDNDNGEDHGNDNGDDHGDDNGNDNGHDQGDDNPGFSHHDDEQGQMGEENCGASALVAGAKVEKAELNVGGAGAFWEEIDLLPQS